jgi:hypothetical protein
LRDERADFGAAGSDSAQGGDPQPFVDRGVNLGIIRDPTSKRDQEALQPRGQLIGVGSGEFAGDTSGESVDRRVYFKELFRLRGELVKLESWMQHEYPHKRFPPPAAL